jgi:hypothetical protein
MRGSVFVSLLSLVSFGSAHFVVTVARLGSFGSAR